MEEELKKLGENALKEINKIKKEADLLNVKAKYLGKGSDMTKFLANLKDMSIDEKKKYGRIINDTKKDLENIFENKLNEINSKNVNEFDDTLPVYANLGTMHPITIVGKEVTDILKRMGFTVLNGPEMETEYFNFEALNVPSTHPARDMQDTYWLSNKMLLRTQTSTNQVHGMQNYGAPIRICAPGRCFRNEDLDACHENTFFQMEGMVIDKNISISNLLYVMEGFLKEVLNENVKI